MPIYEFMCQECGTSFEELVLSSSTLEGLKCPECQSKDVKKKMSTFASRAAGGIHNFSRPAAAPPTCTTST